MGVLLMVLSFFSNMIHELATHLENEEIMCIFLTTEKMIVSLNYLWTLIPNIFHSIENVLIVYCFIGFSIARTPQQIKGLMMCITLETLPFSLCLVFH